jgi:imidazolonepropionase-like amidohydrolase
MMTTLASNRPRKGGVARVADALSNLAAGTIRAPDYPRMPVPPDERSAGELLAIDGVRIVDVDAGRLHDERTLVVDGERIHALLRQGELAQLRSERSVKVVDGADRFVIPGLSDIHCHLSLVSEFDLGLGSLRHFDAQRQRNCEQALMAGCTFVRDSGGAHAIVSWLKSEIDAHRLLGPRILPSYEVLTPRRGMWDVGAVGNAMAPAIFGGPMLHFVDTDAAIEAALEHIAKLGAGCFKTYFEERPLYGGKPDTRYAMFTPAQAKLMRRQADRHGKPLEAHSMFLRGSRLVAEGGFDSVAHLTVDGPYDAQLASLMVENGVAIVPTLSIGCYLAMNCGPAGYPDHGDLRFYRGLLDTLVREQIERCSVDALRSNYDSFREWIAAKQPERRMPMVGAVYPERVHGFARHAAQSLANLRDAGVAIGIGTDGGTGVTFCGQLDVEIEALSHFGFAPAEILRMATLGNMEILRQQQDLGSIAQGKLADLVLLDADPLADARALLAVRQVYKGGRCLVARV